MSRNQSCVLILGLLAAPIAWLLYEHVEYLPAFFIPGLLIGLIWSIGETVDNSTIGSALLFCMSIPLMLTLC